MKASIATFISRVAKRQPCQCLNAGKYPMAIIAIEAKTRMPSTLSDVAIYADLELSKIPAKPTNTLEIVRNAARGN